MSSTASTNLTKKKDQLNLIKKLLIENSSTNLYENRNNT